MYRLNVEKAELIVYVADVAQREDFDMFFTAAKLAGWLPTKEGEYLKASQVGFGLVLGNDGKRFQTRSEVVVKLVDLLDEAKTPNCPQKTKKHEQSNLVEEDLEPTLLMAILEDLEQMKEVEDQKVSLHEEDVGYKETSKESLWYLDNGASNHMTGVREHFKELDEKVSGKVKFGDGSYIEIKGKGSILLECDDERQRIISHVYYIPSLKTH
ncbi:zinc finger, CCHC-type containing protein [Tanacetum coccineum]